MGSDNGDAVAVFARDAATGALTQLPGTAACVSDDANGGVADTPTDPECAAGQGLDQAGGVAVSPDGTNVYVAAQGGSVAAFGRELPPVCVGDVLSVPHGVSMAVPLSCTDPNGLDVLARVVTSPALNGTLGPVDQVAGTVLYTPNPGFFGNDRFSFSGSDGSLSSPVQTVTLAVAGPTAAADVTAPRIRTRLLARRLTRTGKARFRLTCPANEQSPPCIGTLIVKSEKKLNRKRLLSRSQKARFVTLGRKRFSIGAGKTRTVSVRLSKPNRRLVAAVRRLRVRAIVKVADTAGNKTKRTRIVNLKPAKTKKKR